ncbi:MAG: hypothetical protein PHE29_12250 [Tissierellia bacterium]|nr:hypothetical protein [Tissierellia bacterium]
MIKEALAACEGARMFIINIKVKAVLNNFYIELSLDYNYNYNIIVYRKD